MTGPRGLLALLLVPGAIAWNSAPQFEASARALGSMLGHVVPPLSSRPPEPTLVAPEAPLASEPIQEEEALAGKSATPAKGKKRGPAKAKSSDGPSVYVSEADILRLARARAVPASYPVAATADRPGGVQLSGVSALGVGMQDGDVITEVMGRKIRGEGDVVGIVLAARANRARSVSAVFYRGKARGVLVVAMPYMD